MAKTLSESDPFTERALQIYEDAKTQIGYVAHRFRQKIVRDGGLAAAKYWLRPSKATAGFERLLKHDRLDLSVEAVVLQSPWKEFFTPAELATAQECLAQVGYFTRPNTSSTDSTQISAIEGVLTETMTYVRGRSRQLRDLALKKAEGACCVCDVDYSKLLDGKGARVLQVHHRKQLAANDTPRLTSLKDLAVVCANCHMLIHMNPKRALAVEALKKMLSAHA